MLLKASAVNRFAAQEASHPLNPCSGHISAGMNSNLVQTLRAGLLEDEALANFRISGLGDLRRIGMVGRGVRRLCRC